LEFIVTLLTIQPSITPFLVRVIYEFAIAFQTMPIIITYHFIHRLSNTTELLDTIFYLFILFLCLSIAWSGLYLIRLSLSLFFYTCPPIVHIPKLENYLLLPQPYIYSITLSTISFSFILSGLVQPNFVFFYNTPTIFNSHKLKNVHI